MNGEDLFKLVDFVHATWNIRTAKDEKKAAYDSWNRYIGKFEYNDAMDEIDRHALTTKWPPKPVEIRTRLIDPDLPTDQQAWLQAQQLIYAVSSGTELPDTHPLVAETAAQFRNKMTERGFLAIWEQNKGDHLMKLFNA